VIDFEFHFSAHALFNLHKIFFDGLSALLNVDRRGAPENTQMGFSLLDKIALQRSMMMLSPKVGDKFYITEVNWPISGTAPFAPTSEHECVSEEDYALFMLRYYLLAFASRGVDAVFWHQLIASGYGLVDARNGLRKRLAFNVFKTMIKHLQGSKFVSYTFSHDRHTLTCKNSSNYVNVIFSEHKQSINLKKEHKVFSFDGVETLCNKVLIDEKPIYVYTEAKL
jgi:hypothetical protein